LKRFLIPFFLVLLTGCQYGSFREAVEACKVWMDKGGNYKKGLYETNRRYCTDEAVTQKILGIDKKLDKVKKRFKY